MGRTVQHDDSSYLGLRLNDGNAAAMAAELHAALVVD
jgi:hypothetical protein